MANKHSSLGTQLKVSISSTLTTIPSCTTTTAPGVNRVFEDVTALDSTGSFAEFRAVVNEPTEVSATIILDLEDSTHIYLINSASNAAMPVESWELEFTQMSALAQKPKITFSGELSRWEPRAQGRETVKSDFSVRVSGAWTFTAASA